MDNRDILISGASVAGPALAYWLARYGFKPTVVERSPQLRGGGYAVDFRGAVHLSVLEKMGILDQVRERQTHLATTTYVDEAGRLVAQMPAEIFAGDVEILRGDLGEVLYEATRDRAEYLFGDSITSLAETGSGVDVTFERAAPRTFGLVIGADGLHSNVRTLAFGDEAGFASYLGLHVSIFSVADSSGLDHAGLLYSVPGRTASIFSSARPGRAVAMLYFSAPAFSYDHRDTGQQQEIVAGAFTGMGWRVPELLGQMAEADDFYFDSVSQIHMGRWSSGRVALIGDAACAAGPGGNGTGNAVVAAYILAGELATADGDYRAACGRYERLVRPYAARGQKQALGGKDFLAPATAKKIKQRDRAFRMMSHLPVKRLVRYLSTRTATAIRLPDYSSVAASRVTNAYRSSGDTATSMAPIAGGGPTALSDPITAPASPRSARATLITTAPLPDATSR